MLRAGSDTPRPRCRVGAHSSMGSTGGQKRGGLNWMSLPSGMVGIEYRAWTNARPKATGARRRERSGAGCGWSAGAFGSCRRSSGGAPKGCRTNPLVSAVLRQPSDYNAPPHFVYGLCDPALWQQPALRGACRHRCGRATDRVLLTPNPPKDGLGDSP